MYVMVHQQVLDQIIIGLVAKGGVLSVPVGKDFAVDLRDALSFHKDVDPGVVCRLIKEHTKHGRVEVVKVGAYRRYTLPSMIR